MARRTLEEYRSAGALAELEDDWVEAISDRPEDVDGLLALALPLAADGEEERARSLLELWDAELKGGSLWTARLDLLRRAGHLAVKANRLQREVLATLEALWGSRSNFQALVEHVALHKPTEDRDRLWDKVTRLQSLLVYDIGEVVTMAGQGIGKVVEVNLPLETLKIDFEKKKGVTVGFRAAAKLLRVLPLGHILRRKVEAPEELARLRDEQPAELLRAVLEAADKPYTAAEIRESVAGIVSEAQWASWWSAARKHPQVVTVGSGRQTYRWETSTAGAVDALRRAFDRAPARQKIELLRRNAERFPKVARELAGALASTAGELAEQEPGVAFEAWFLLERLGLVPDRLPWSAESLLFSGADLRRLLAGIEDRLLRERAYAMLRERRSDWPSLFRDFFFREEEPRALHFLAQALRQEAPAEIERALDDLISQPRRAPAAFVWLAEEAAEDEGLRARNPSRLLSQILAATASDEFGAYRTRLRALADSGQTLPRLLSHLSEDQAAGAVEAVAKASGLEPFQRDGLRNALMLRFPSLNQEASGRAAPFYATPEAIAARREELRRLVETEIPTNRKAIEEARALGDLRENFEYKSARQRHEYLNARVATLHNDLGRVRPVDAASVDTGEIRIGTRVELGNGTGERRSITILGPWDSRPEAGVLSYESELAKTLLGKKLGERVDFAGEALVVESIEPFS
ncbi:MAG: GreA/GreB family elongation factor [Thermoanaerobaculia bacterium]